MKVFVAGHTGLVGSSLIRTIPQGYELVTATRLELDLTDFNQVQNFLSGQNIDAIILAAAKVGGIGANSTQQKEFILENLTIQNSVIPAAAEVGISKLLFLGSSCIYPKLAPQPISEAALLTGPLEPTNEGYALAKILGIRLCQAIFDQDGFDYFSVMPTNLYGPGDNFDRFSSHVPAALMRKFHEAKVSGEPEVTVWGTGNPRREFMHVDDLARACWHLLSMKLGGELINVGTGSDISIREFAETIARVVGFQGEIVYDHSKPDGMFQKLLDVTKVHSLGWQHEIDLESGLQGTYNWFTGALASGSVRGFN